MKNGTRVYAVLSVTFSEVALLGFGVYVGDEIPPAPVGFMRALYEATTWEEVDRRPTKDLQYVSRLASPKIVLDNGEIVWGAECWWGLEAAYTVLRKGRVEKQCSIAAARDEHQLPKDLP